MYERFEVGQLIDWKETISPELEGVKNDLGPGPFEVEKVIDVPKDDQAAVRHHQWVVLSKEVEGKKYRFDFWKNTWTLAPLPEFPPPHENFSGYFFKSI